MNLSERKTVRSFNFCLTSFQIVGIPVNSVAIAVRFQ